MGKLFILKKGLTLPVVGPLTASSAGVTLPFPTGLQNVSSWDVQRSPDGTTWSNVTTGLAANTTTYQDTSGTAGSIYYYRLIVYYKATGAATGATGKLLAAPTVTLTPANTSISVSVTTVTGATTYKIERSPNGTSSWTILQNTSTTTYNDTGLTNGTIYYYRATAIGANGPGVTSNVVSGVPGAIPDHWNVVFKGDSLTAGYPYNSSTYGGQAAGPLANDAYTYPTQLWTSLAPTNSTKENYGIYNEWLSHLGGGSVSGGMIGAEATEMYPAYDSSKTVNIAVVWAGINDIAGNTSAATLETDLTTYCQNLRTHGFLVVVCTLPKASSVTGANDTTRTTHNTWLAANYLTFADVLVDLASLTHLQNTSDTTYFYDGVHLTNLGYGDVATAVQSGLQGMVGNAGTGPTLTATNAWPSVNLSWTAVTNARYYQVLRATVSGGPYTVVNGGVAGTSLTDSATTGLVNGTTYYYVVRAVVGAQQTLSSTEQSVAFVPAANSLVWTLYASNSKTSGVASTNGQLVDTVTDTGGMGNAVASGAARPTFSATGSKNGGPTLTSTTSPAVGMNVPHFYMQNPHTLHVVYKLTTGGMLWEHVNDAFSAGKGSWLLGTTGTSTFEARASVESGWNDATNWSADNVWHVATVTFDGTHAGHKFYIDGVLTQTDPGTYTGNPGTATLLDTLYLMSRGSGSAFLNAGSFTAYECYNYVRSGAQISSDVTRLSAL